jgi:hypothetical protein
MRKDYKTAVKEIAAAGPEIGKAVGAFEQLLLQDITGDHH